LAKVAPRLRAIAFCSAWRIRSGVSGRAMMSSAPAEKTSCMKPFDCAGSSWSTTTGRSGSRIAAFLTSVSVLADLAEQATIMRSAVELRPVACAG
jgi:hypothetical protein